MKKKLLAGLAVGVLMLGMAGVASAVTDLPTLTPGWNLVGLMVTADQPAMDVTELGDVTSVWKWATVNGTKTWAVYLPAEGVQGAYAASKGFGQFETIEPGEGFWVNVPAPTITTTTLAPTTTTTETTSTTTTSTSTTTTTLLSKSVNIADYMPQCTGSQWQLQKNGAQSFDTTTATIQENIGLFPAMLFETRRDIDNQLSHSFRGWSDSETGFFVYDSIANCKNNTCQSTTFVNPIHSPANVISGTTYSDQSEVISDGVSLGTMTWTIKFDAGGTINTPAGQFTDTILLGTSIAGGGGVSLNWYAKGFGLIRHDEPNGYTEKLTWANVCGNVVGTKVTQ